MCNTNGKTQDLNKRLTVYNSGLIHNQKVVFWFETDNFDSLESCVKDILKSSSVNDKGKEVYHIKMSDIVDVIEVCDYMISNIGCGLCDKHYLENGSLKSHFENLHANEKNKKIIFEKKHEGGAIKMYALVKRVDFDKIIFSM